MSKSYQEVPSKVNADFSKMANTKMATANWVKSPMKGVDRILLDRIGGEIARATSIVRYAPGSYFSPHIHSGGEEFVVLEGVFQDEHGDYPVGSYVRNPPQSSHQPKSEQGCIIFVKLWQFEPNDRLTINRPVWPPAIESNSSENILYKDECEHVACIKLPSTNSLTYTQHDGLELLVLAGSVKIETIENNLPASQPACVTLNKHDWHRRPIGDSCIISGLGGGNNTETPLIWIKTNHLKQLDGQIERVLQA